MLLQWGENTNEIAKQIKSRQGFLKIILKTFNDGFFLERWIEHHANIVGLENLVIADNMSTDEDVLAIYEKYGKELFVFQFSGNHNNIHKTGGLFKALYDALRLSCQYMLFIDTDEFLVWLDETRWYADSSVVERLKSISPKGAIPASLMQNAPHSDSIFHLSYLSTWGKPFIPNQFREEGLYINHNVQCPKLNFWTRAAVTNFFLLHLTRLSSDQRIKINKSKLVKHGFCSNNDSIQAILEKDWRDCKNKTAIRFVNEIRDCIKNQYDEREYQDIPENCLKLLSDGVIDFASETEKSVLKQFIDEPELTIRFSLDLPIEGINEIKMSVVDFMTKANACRNAGRFVVAKDAFAVGMKNFPNHLDQYGHPAFKKELMRLLLSQQKWDEAAKLIPNQGDLGGGYWHEILFARAYLTINDITNAKIWWDRVVEKNPGNTEAKKFFDKLKTV